MIQLLFPAYLHTRLLILVILTSCLLISCGPGSGDAASYNDAIITEQNKVANKGEAFFSSLDISKEEMEKAYQAFCTQVDQSLEVTQQLGSFDGKAEFLDAAIKSLQMYRSLCDHEYKTIVEILAKPDDEITDEDTERYHAAIKDCETKLEPLRIGLDASQMKFSQEWNFTIDATKTFE